MGHIISVPTQVLRSLRELELFGTKRDEGELVGLDSVFCHATSLESLCICGILAPAFTSFFPSYQMTGVLPNLTSFRLTMERHSYIDHKRDKLWKFLLGRPILRRLYIRIPSMWGSEMALPFFTTTKSWRMSPVRK
ncbi:hypothetical protein BDN70DRAFT_603560 [Pholiota conissans]|uniref:Uncharacterized protein n=1 Tax=Pholiota conissans TaxID=109636 RepID=A0A9P5Z3S6_9AGAR|nr:hypothetical protein BDN70DRAFT_603560 [Pholiota conissans]